MSDTVSKVVFLRESLDRADHLATTQAQVIETQGKVISLQEKRIKQLESELAELRCAG